MNRQTHDLIQGAPEWHQFRSTHFGASEAGAMLGISPYKTRNELLREKKTGLTKEFSQFVQERVLDRGHAIESNVRQLAESVINEDLFPVTMSFGNMSASCDGLTFDELLAWECKQFNAEDFETVKNGELPEKHWPQCQQVMYVTGAETLLFTISDGTTEGTAHVWVTADVELQQRIIDGWAQFKKDLETFELVEAQEKPIAEPTESLPAVSIRVDGGLAVISNLELFGVKLREFCGNLTKDPQDDQDFSNLEQACKDLKKAEDALDAAANMALAQISDVNDMRRTVADLKEIARSHRLTSEKLVKSQKEVIKLKILSDVKDKFSRHIAGLQAEIKGVTLNIATPDFGGAMKNKRTIASLHDAVDSVLAAAKIDADATAKDWRVKLAWCNDAATGYGFLFRDLQALITKPRDDFELAITSRINEHREQERIKAEAAAKEQAEREERIRQEAEAKAKREAEERQRLEIESARKQAAEEERQRIEAENAKLAAEQDAKEKLVAEAIKTVEAHQDELKKPAERYTRSGIIRAVAFEYGVTTQEAEQWLIEEFSKVTTA